MNRRSFAAALAAAAPSSFFVNEATAAETRLDCNAEAAREFMRSRLEAVLAASSLRDALDAIPRIFAADYVSYGGNAVHDISWLERHAREVRERLDRVRIDVMHAVRCGGVVASRHSVAAVTRADGKDWKIEVIGFYELTPDEKIKVSWQHGQMRTGEYYGW